MKSCSPWVIQQQKSAVPFPFMSLLVSLFMFLPFRHLARVLPFLPFLPDHTAYQHGYEWVSQRAYVAHLGQCHCADHSPVHIWTPSFQVSVPWQRDSDGAVSDHGPDTPFDSKLSLCQGRIWRWVRSRSLCLTTLSFPDWFIHQSAEQIKRLAKYMTLVPPMSVTEEMDEYTFAMHTIEILDSNVDCRD